MPASVSDYFFFRIIFFSRSLVMALCVSRPCRTKTQPLTQEISHRAAARRAAVSSYYLILLPHITTAYKRVPVLAHI